MADNDNQKKQKSVDTEKAKTQKLTTYTGIAVVAIILIAVVVYIINSRQAQTTPSAPTTATFNLEGEPVVGDTSAKVAVVEFADFKCPFCKKFHDDTFNLIYKNYVIMGKVAFYFVNFPIPNATGKDSPNAAYAAECVFQKGPVAFWKYYDMIYANQGNEQEEWATPANLVKMMKDHNVIPDMNEQEMTDCITKMTFKSDVDADYQMGIKAGVQATPTIFVNGKLISNPTYTEIKKAIDAALGS
jgi:protein-disulfide isomerase